MQLEQEIGLIRKKTLQESAHTKKTLNKCLMTYWRIEINVFSSSFHSIIKLHPQTNVGLFHFNHSYFLIAQLQIMQNFAQSLANEN